MCCVDLSSCVNQARPMRPHVMQLRTYKPRGVDWRRARMGGDDKHTHNNAQTRVVVKAE